MNVCIVYKSLSSIILFTLHFWSFLVFLVIRPFFASLVPNSDSLLLSFFQSICFILFKKSINWMNERTKERNWRNLSEWWFVSNKQCLSSKCLDFVGFCWVWLWFGPENSASLQSTAKQNWMLTPSIEALAMPAPVWWLCGTQSGLQRHWSTEKSILSRIRNTEIGDHMKASIFSTCDRNSFLCLRQSRETRAERRRALRGDESWVESRVDFHLVNWISMKRWRAHPFGHSLSVI